MLKGSSRLIPVALASLLVTSAVALAACSSNDDESDRQASGGKTEAWSASAGNSYGGLRGVEVDFVNSYRYTKRPIEVGVVGNGLYCPDNATGDLCWRKREGIDPRAIPPNEFGKWKSLNGEVLFSADVKQEGTLRTLRSTLAWPDPDEGPEPILDRINFSVTNPTIGKPKFIIGSGRGSDCLLEFSNQDRVVALNENQSQTLTGDGGFCQIKLKITRQSDSTHFKRFTVEAL